MDEREKILQVQNLTVSFRTNEGMVRAVRDISFDLYKGETLAIVGESGSGKSVTARSLMGILAPNAVVDGGSILYEDVDLLKLKESEFHKYRGNKLGMIFQDPMASLNPRMTIKEIIAEGLRIRGVKDEKQIDQQVFSVLEKVGLLREHANRYPHEFSGGQRQRIGVARAIIMEPKMIIADEPVSALDVSIQTQVINPLGALREEMGISILFIAHDLSVVKYFSDRIGVMYFGHLVELAESDELFARPLHGYTQSLLSAIPMPDPHYEKQRTRIIYQPPVYTPRRKRTWPCGRSSPGTSSAAPRQKPGNWELRPHEAPSGEADRPGLRRPADAYQRSVPDARVRGSGMVPHFEQRRPGAWVPADRCGRDAAHLRGRAV